MCSTILKKVLSPNVLNSRIRTNLTSSLRSLTRIPDVLVEETNDVGILTLNRPRDLNILNLSMIQKIIPVLKRWEDEKKLVIVKGYGDQAFSAGEDVKTVALEGLKGRNLGQQFYKNEYLLNSMIGNYKIPYLAIIDGLTIGGASGLAVHGKYRVATERTLFALPETGYGSFPDAGSSHFLPRLKSNIGQYLALTGDALRGADVKHAGIATHFVKSQCLPNLLTHLKSCKTDGDVERVLKKWKLETDKFSKEPVLKTMKLAFAGKTMEKIVQYLKEEHSHFSQSTLKLLSKKSPTSMKVTKAALEWGKNKSLDECLGMEYRIMLHTLNKREFYEGVRAHLIERDHRPRWKPADIMEVDDDVVKSYFAPLPPEHELPLLKKPTLKKKK